MKTFLPASLFALALVAALPAEPRLSANYSIAADGVDSGGARTASAAYVNDGSSGNFAGVSASDGAAETLKGGFIGQIYDVTGLSVTAAATTVKPGADLQLVAWQTLDDATLLGFPEANTFQWLFNGTPITGATESEYGLMGVQSSNAGAYAVRVTQPDGSVTLVDAVTLTVTTAGARLVNIATRAYCSSGNRVTIGGFVVAGSGTKRVLVRAVGPTLTTQGIDGGEVLVDPMIEVHDASHGDSVIATNDNWGDNANATEISAVSSQIGATALIGSDAKSSALLLTLPAGVYSFVVNGKGATSGIVLLEIYDADAVTTEAKFVNIATRAYATTGNGVTIGGFVISGDVPKAVLLRAVGSTLSTQGLDVSEVLIDPAIELHAASQGNAVIATNDNWGDNANAAAILTTAARIGATPFNGSDSKSAALLMTLEPGVYSFVASGKSSSSGIVLVEVYDAD